MRHVPPFTKVSFERTNIKVSSIKKEDRVMSRKNEKETSSRRSKMLPYNLNFLCNLFNYRPTLT